ncbi:MAG: AmmeMemoRadiSam system protein B [Sandaracinaceae bacterium]
MDRPAPLAGRWYPRDPGACRDAVERYGADAEPASEPHRGLLAPHAGWAFSGDVAGRGYRGLAAAHPDPSVVVLFGSHRGPDGPDTVFVGEGWATPLGRIATHPMAATLREALSLAEEPREPIRPDNAVELHLPFIAHYFPGAPMIMLGIAMAPAALEIGRHVGAALREAGEAPVFIGSTDLTHYGPNYAFAPRGRGPEAVRWVREENDRGFLDAIEQGDPGRALAHGIEHQSACCPGAAAATMEAVRAFEGAVHPRLVSHTLSWDIRPDDSFVGYASVLL